MLVCAALCSIIVDTADSQVQERRSGKGPGSMTYFLVYCILTVTLFLSFS